MTTMKNGHTGIFRRVKGKSSPSMREAISHINSPGVVQMLSNPKM